MWYPGRGSSVLGCVVVGVGGSPDGELAGTKASRVALEIRRIDVLLLILL